MHNIALAFIVLISFCSNVSASNGNDDDKDKGNWKVVYKGKGVSLEEREKKRRENALREGGSLESKIIRLFPKDCRKGEKFVRIMGQLKGLDQDAKTAVFELTYILGAANAEWALTTFLSIRDNCKKKSSPRLHTLLQEVDDRTLRCTLLTEVNEYAKSLKQKPTAAQLVNFLKIISYRKGATTKEVCAMLDRLSQSCSRGTIIYTVSLFKPYKRKVVLAQMDDLCKINEEIKVSSVISCMQCLNTDDLKLTYLQLVHRCHLAEQYQEVPALILYAFNNKLIPPTRIESAFLAMSNSDLKVLVEIASLEGEGVNVVYRDNLLKYLIQSELNSHGETKRVRTLQYFGTPLAELVNTLGVFVQKITKEKDIIYSLMVSDRQISFHKMQLLSKFLANISEDAYNSSHESLSFLLRQVRKIKFTDRKADVEVVLKELRPEHTFEQRMLMYHFITSRETNNVRTLRSSAQRLLTASQHSADLLLECVSKGSSEAIFDQLIEGWVQLGPLLEREECSDLKRRLEGLNDDQLRRTIPNLEHLAITLETLNSDLFDHSQLERALAILRNIRTKAPDVKVFRKYFDERVKPEHTLAQRAIVYLVLSLAGISEEDQVEIIESVLAQPLIDVEKFYVFFRVLRDDCPKEQRAARLKGMLTLNSRVGSYFNIFKSERNSGCDVLDCLVALSDSLEPTHDNISDLFESTAPVVNRFINTLSVQDMQRFRENIKPKHTIQQRAALYIVLGLKGVSEEYKTELAQAALTLSNFHVEKFGDCVRRYGGNEQGKHLKKVMALHNEFGSDHKVLTCELSEEVLDCLITITDSIEEDEEKRRRTFRSLFAMTQDSNEIIWTQIPVLDEKCLKAFRESVKPNHTVAQRLALYYVLGIKGINEENKAKLSQSALALSDFNMRSLCMLVRGVRGDSDALRLNQKMILQIRLGSSISILDRRLKTDVLNCLVTITDGLEMYRHNRSFLKAFEEAIGHKTIDSLGEKEAAKYQETVKAEHTFAQRAALYFVLGIKGISEESKDELVDGVLSLPDFDEKQFLMDAMRVRSENDAMNLKRKMTLYGRFAPELCMFGRELSSGALNCLITLTDSLENRSEQVPLIEKLIKALSDDELVTLGEQGMAVFKEHVKPHHTICQRIALLFVSGIKGISEESRTALIEESLTLSTFNLWKFCECVKSVRSDEIAAHLKKEMVLHKRIGLFLEAFNLRAKVETLDTLLCLTADQVIGNENAQSINNTVRVLERSTMRSLDEQGMQTFKRTAKSQHTFEQKAALYLAIGAVGLTEEDRAKIIDQILRSPSLNLIIFHPYLAECGEERGMKRLKAMMAVHANIGENWDMFKYVNRTMPLEGLESFVVMTSLLKKGDTSQETLSKLLQACAILFEKEGSAVLDAKVAARFLSADFVGNYDLEQRLDLVNILQKVSGEALDLVEDIERFLSLSSFWRECFFNATEDVDALLYLPVLKALPLIGTQHHDTTEVKKYAKGTIQCLKDLSRKGIDIVALAGALGKDLSKDTVAQLRCLAVMDQSQWKDKAGLVVDFITSVKGRLQSDLLGLIALCDQQPELLQKLTEIAKSNRNTYITRELSDALVLHCKAYNAVPSKSRGKVLELNFSSPKTKFIEEVAKVYPLDQLKAYWVQQLDSANRDYSGFFADLILHNANELGLGKTDALYIRALDLKTDYLRQDLDSYELETADAAARFIEEDSYRGGPNILGLKEEDYLTQRAAWVRLATYSPNDPRNPYTLYDYLRFRRALPFNFGNISPPLQSVVVMKHEEEEIADETISCQWLAEEVAKVKAVRVKVKDLAAFDNKLLFKMRTHFLKRLETQDGDALNQKAMDISKASIDHASSLTTLLKNLKDGGILQSMLETSSDPDDQVDTNNAKFICVVRFMQNLPSERGSNLLSEQESYFLNMLCSIPYCEIRKLQGVIILYKALPKQFQLEQLVDSTDYLEDMLRSVVEKDLITLTEGMLYEPSLFVEEVCGLKWRDIDNAVHPQLYLTSLLGAVLPYGDMRIDPYTNQCLPSALTSRSLTTVLATFYRHFKPADLVPTVMLSLNEVLAKNKSGAFEGIQRLFAGNVENEKAWEIGEGIKITPYGTIHLLAALNLLKIVE